jgi:hypothetical protein
MGYVFSIGGIYMPHFFGINMRVFTPSTASRFEAALRRNNLQPKKIIVPNKDVSAAILWKMSHKGYQDRILYGNS